MFKRMIFLVLSMIFLSACAETIAGKEKKGFSDKNSLFFIRSSAFMNDTYIPRKYTCDGDDISPDLYWGDFPPGTQSFVIIMEDPDAPFGVFVHWIVYDIPYYMTNLRENLPKTSVVDGIFKQGINDFGKIGYNGPCPPRGMPHRYFIRIYAIDIPTLGLPPGATKEDVRHAMEGHILSQTYLMGRYGR